MDSDVRKARSGKRQGDAPKISDVAALAGVSPMTVSRVINAETNVRERTRERVNVAIAQLNFAPNRAARALAGAKQMRIALLYSNPSAAYLTEFLVGSLDQASRSDIQLIVEKCEIGDHERAVAERLVSSGIDGVVLPPPLCDSAAILDILLGADIPTVVVATGRTPQQAASVRIDDFHAAKTMTAHLLALGHIRIGFIVGNPNQTVSNKRLAGYRAALQDEGIDGDDTLVAQGLFTYRSGLDAADRLMEIAEPPTAIFASNDDMAAATVAIAHRRGLDVPGDLTVCGFDDSALSTTIWPELTTIRQPIAAMSRAAVELLAGTVHARRHGKPDEVRHVLLDYVLVRRQSDAAPRRRPPGRMMQHGIT